MILFQTNGTSNAPTVADQTCALVYAVPTDSLAYKGRDERTADAKQRRYDETCRFIGSGRNEFGDNTSDESDNDDPYDIRHDILLKLGMGQPKRA